MDGILYSLFVHLTAESGSRKDIVSFFGGEKNVFEAGEDEWCFCPHISEKALARMKRINGEYIEKIIRQCEENDWQIITENDEAYPAGLKMFDDSPGVLFVSGNPMALDGLICVSGTRKINEGGETACEKAADAVHESGRKVLSFDTPGCDAAAIKYALTYGSVCMALAGGLGTSANRRLSLCVADMGAVVSTFAPLEKPSPVYFHMRNRLASRLCDAAIITQTDEKGNSLFVASQFRKAGKPVFAAAGSAGCDRLLNDYAYILRAPLENVILSHSAGALQLNAARKAPAKIKKEDKNNNNLDTLTQHSILASTILQECGGKTDMDELLLKSGLPMTEAMSAVTELELNGIAATDAGNRCILL
ncbi:MAG: DNA-protecting protein DprA [Clostridia bacterium]|nr:DNA-protecting protein DprA [Clostridia bacterium]